MVDTAAAAAAGAEPPPPNTRALLRLVLTRNPLFVRLEAVTIDALVFAMRRVELQDGQRLFRAGDAADGLLVVEKCATDTPYPKPQPRLRNADLHQLAERIAVSESQQLTGNAPRTPQTLIRAFRYELVDPHCVTARRAWWGAWCAHRGSLVVGGGETTARTSTSPPHAEGTPNEVVKGRRRVAAGTLMGEAAVLYSCTRASTVRAESATVLWTLSRDVFTAVVRAHQPVGRDISGENDGSGWSANLSTLIPTIQRAVLSR